MKTITCDVCGETQTYTDDGSPHDICACDRATEMPFDVQDMTGPEPSPPVQVEMNGVKLVWPDGRPVFAGELRDDEQYNVNPGGVVTHDPEASARHMALRLLLTQMEEAHNAEVARLTAIKPATRVQADNIHKNLLAIELDYELAVVRETFFASTSVDATVFCELMFTLAREWAVRGLKHVRDGFDADVRGRVYQQFIAKMTERLLQEQLIELQHPASRPNLLGPDGRPLRNN